MEEFNKLSSDGEKKQFLGNYLYQCVLKRLAETKTDLPEEAK